MLNTKGAKVKSVKAVGKQDVYNLEVRNHHNFSVNGGLIVHNCKDEERYFVNTVIVKRGIRFLK